jgi:hypothetical protein
MSTAINNAKEIACAPEKRRSIRLTEPRTPSHPASVQTSGLRRRSDGEDQVGARPESCAAATWNRSKRSTPACRCCEARPHARLGGRAADRRDFRHAVALVNLEPRGASPSPHELGREGCPAGSAHSQRRKVGAGRPRRVEPRPAEGTRTSQARKMKAARDE